MFVFKCLNAGCVVQFGFVGRWFSSGRATVGALDFGGASTQITFVTQQKVEDEANRKELRLYGHVYSLYTHSFLCYGQDQLLKKLLAQIVKVRRSFCSQCVQISQLFD